MTGFWEEQSPEKHRIKKINVQHKAQGPPWVPDLVVPETNYSPIIAVPQANGFLLISEGGLNWVSVTCNLTFVNLSWRPQQFYSLIYTDHTVFHCYHWKCFIAFFTVVKWDIFFHYILCHCLCIGKLFNIIWNSCYIFWNVCISGGWGGLVVEVCACVM